jgi:hypothetical protein
MLLVTGSQSKNVWLGFEPQIFGLPVQLSYRGSLILCVFYTIFSDQLIILTSFPYMGGISPFRMRFEQVIRDIINGVMWSDNTMKM